MSDLNRIPELLKVSRRAGKAMIEYNMVSHGDKIAVAVSGGKDSISLLHVLRHRQRVSPVKFEMWAVHIDFDLANFDPKPLVEYFEREGFKYLVERVEGLEGEDYNTIDCFSWSRARRRALFDIAAREGFTKIAFGHHLDDTVETILLNQFYRGEIGTMKPKQELFGGKITIIRPLVYEREHMMVKLAEKLNIQSIGGQSKCANDDTSHRMIIKKMLRDLEKNNPHVVPNIFSSLKNIRTDYLLNPSTLAQDDES